MALKTIVKVSHVTNLSDARYCAGMGVDMIGYNLDENHPKFIDLARMREISNWISGIHSVGEFSGDNIYNMNYLSEQLNLDVIQLNHPVNPQLLSGLKKPAIQKLNITAEDIPELNQLVKKYADGEKASFILLDSDSLHSVHGLEQKLSEVCSEYRILLGFGVKKEDLDIILNKIVPAGIELKGGEEIKPGLKDYEHLSEILELLEEE